MAHCDFVVKYNKKKDTMEDIVKRILYSVIIKRIKAKKPVVWFMGGDSGEGKSYTAIKIQELLMEVQGLDIRKNFNDINVYTPIEYTRKVDNLLFNKNLKKVNIVCMHEAREVVKAKLWQTFITQAIADINAMSRQIKRLCIIVISQFIRDITTDMRYTLNFYSIIRRPKGKPARLYINILWKDDRDLEKPKLRKRKLSGYLQDETGRYIRFVPQYLELGKPSKDLCEIFEKSDFEAKTTIIRKKLNKLEGEIKAEMNIIDRKVEDIVDWYIKNPESISLVGKKWRGKWKLKKEAAKIHDLNQGETRTFERLFNKKFKEEGIRTGAIEDEGKKEFEATTPL